MASDRDEIEALKRRLEESERQSRRERQLREEAEEQSRRDQEQSRRDQQLREEAEEQSRRDRQLREEAEEQSRRDQEQSRRDRQLREEAEKQTRPTTLDQYISGCHTIVYSAFAVETKKSLTTQGTTSPRNKWCPTHLRPWTGFLDRQRTVYSTLYNAFPSHLEVFPPLSDLAGIGRVLSTRRIGNEKNLEFFLHLSVEAPVSAIVSQLKDVPQASEAFNLSNGVVFEISTSTQNGVKPCEATI